MVESIGPSDIRTVEMLVSELVNHMLDDSLLIEVLVERTSLADVIVTIHRCPRSSCQ